MSGKKYDLKPSKEAYQAVKSDVTPVSAFKELIDNALDNWRRVLDGLDELNIDIEYYEGGEDGKERIIIRDDSGGVEEEDLHILFALGQSKKENIAGSIGAYGVGAKKAIVNLGNQATIRSRHLYADTGFGFSINEEWLQDDDDWTVDKIEYDDIDEGVTEIVISDLNTPWEKYREKLSEDLAATYQWFLQPGRLEGLEQVNIAVREFDAEGEQDSVEEIEPPEPVDWSFTPMDGLYARRYEGIELHSREFDDEVTLNVTVGLMCEASSDKAGADIFCQNRQVLSGVQDERAGFGGGSGSSHLGKFSGQHRRLRVLIEFETEGDAKVLPWDAQKSDIDPYTRVSRAAYNWIRRIVQPYYRAAGEYDKVPTALTRPYDRDCEYSITEHLDGPYDYSGNRERVTNKPDDDFPEAQMIGERADVTAALGVYSMGDLDEKFEPAYREEFYRQLREDYDVEFDSDDPIGSGAAPTADVPDDLTVGEALDVHEELNREATEHAERTPPERMTGLEPWKQELYDWLLRQAIHARVKREIDAFDDADEEVEVDIGLDIDWQSDEDVTIDLDDLEAFEIEDESNDDETSMEATADESEDATDDVDLDGVDTDGETDSMEEGEEGEESVTTTDDISHDGEVDDSDGAAEQRTLDPDSVGQDAEESASGGDGTDVLPSSGPSTPMHYTLDLTEEEWETLVGALGLDEDASPEEVREQLLNTVTVLRDLPTMRSSQ